MKITKELLIACGGSEAHAGIYAEMLEKWRVWGGVTTPLRLAHFLAQILHESGGLRAVVERASGAAYEGRVDLGNVHPGDGKRYKGRGLIHTTGRANYDDVSDALGVAYLSNPEYLERPEDAVKSAYYFWGSRRLNRLADKDDMEAITRIINGGLNGFNDRKRYLVRCKQALSC